jgi:hypothetical protein
MSTTLNTLEKRMASGKMKPDQVSEKQKKKIEKDLEIYKIVKSLPCFDIDFQSDRTRSYRIGNVVRIIDAEFEQYIIEYSEEPATTGNRRVIYVYTYTFLKPKSTQVPDFSLYPHDETPDDIGKAITFDNYPKFTKQYTLVSDDGDEDAVRDIFTDEIITFFMHNKRFILHCSDNTLKIELSKNDWIYGPMVASVSRYPKNSCIGDYIDTTEHLLRLFRESLHRSPSMQ